MNVNTKTIRLLRLIVLLAVLIVCLSIVAYWIIRPEHSPRDLSTVFNKLNTKLSNNQQETTDVTVTFTDSNGNPIEQSLKLYFTNAEEWERYSGTKTETRVSDFNTLIEKGFAREVTSDQTGVFHGAIDNGDYYIVLEPYLRAAFPGKIGRTRLRGGNQSYTIALIWEGPPKLRDIASQESGEDGSAIVYEVAKGDTLWDIARHYYGREDLWRGILDANNPITSSNECPLIYPGDHLIIPATDTSFGLKLHSLSAIDYSIISQQPQQEINNPAVGPGERLNGIDLSVKHAIGPDKGNMISLEPEDYGKAIDWKDCRSCTSKSFVPPMQAYREKTGKGWYEHNFRLCWDAIQALFPNNTFSGHTLEQCVKSPDGNRFAFRSIYNTNRFYEVVDGEEQEQFQYTDQFVFSPNSQSYAYRAQGDDGWYIISNGNPIGPFEYIQTLFYLQNDDLYYLTKENNSWKIYKNGEEFDSADYIDTLIYTEHARSFAYRIMNYNDNHQEQWAVRLAGGSTSTSWNFADQLYNTHGDVILFRTRDDLGAWRIMKLINDNSQLVFEPDNKTDELFSYWFNPLQTATDKPSLVIMFKKDGSYYLYGHESNRYAYIRDIYFGPKGNHYTLRGAVGDIGSDYFVVDGVHRKLIYYLSDIWADTSPKIKFFRSGFDGSGNIVLYTIIKPETVIKETYSLK